MPWLRYCAAGLAAAALVVLLLLPRYGHCDSVLPEPLNEAFSTLAAIEQSLEGRRWQEALTALGKLQEITERAVREAGPAADENFLYHVGYSCGRLESSLRRRDREACEDYYRDIQDLYLRLAGSLVKGEPPALGKIVGFLAEARDWNDKSNYREVVFDLREVSRYFRGVYPMLEAKGVEHPEIWDFHGEVNRAMAAAEAGSASQAKVSLDRLESMAAGFRALFADMDRPQAATGR